MWLATVPATPKPPGPRRGANGPDARDRRRADAPDLQTDEGLRAAVVLRRTRPDVAILILSQYVEERYATDLLSGGSRGVGYLLKDRVADVAEFMSAARRVAGGGTAIDPEVVAQLLSRRRRNDVLSELTPREREVLGLMAEGRTNPRSRNASSSRRGLLRSTFATSS